MTGEKRRYLRRSSDHALNTIQEDLKVLNQMFEQYEPYLKMAIEREARRAAFQKAIIEKTAVACLWAFLITTGALLYNGAASHLKNLFAGLK